MLQVGLASWCESRLRVQQPSALDGAALAEIEDAAEVALSRHGVLVADLWTTHDSLIRRRPRL